jgi:hypothetical protein
MRNKAIITRGPFICTLVAAAEGRLATEGLPCSRVNKKIYFNLIPHSNEIIVINYSSSLSVKTVTV